MYNYQNQLNHMKDKPLYNFYTIVHIIFRYKPFKNINLDKSFYILVAINRLQINIYLSNI